MLLVLILGSLMQVANLSLGLIGTEVLLILLPALIVLRARHILRRSACSALGKCRLRIVPLEKLDLQAGSFETWKATVGDKAAWYASGDTSRPVQFDDGMVLYRLVNP